MNDDLISRQATINTTINMRSRCDNDINDFYDLLIESFKVLPSAEQKRGKWVDIVEMDSGDYPFKVGVCCSACGFETVNEDNYCPNCGVKMKGDIE